MEWIKKKSSFFNHLRVFTVCIYKVHGLLGVPKRALQPGSTDCNTDVHCRIPVHETRPARARWTGRQMAAFARASDHMNSCFGTTLW